MENEKWDVGVDVGGALVRIHELSEDIKDAVENDPARLDELERQWERRIAAVPLYEEALKRARRHVHGPVAHKIDAALREGGHFELTDKMRGTEEKNQR